jgi:ATP-dependent Clp protease ATP-binding subunit ClpC
MFERYTESARRTLFFARYEVSQAGATEIGPEHLLLGLIRQPEGLVGRLLADARVSLEAIRGDIERMAAAGARIPTSVEIPFAGETQAVLRAAAEEADRLHHSHIGTEHLLLGLLVVEHSRAASILTARGLRLDDVRRRIVTLLDESRVWLVPVDAAGEIDRIKRSVQQLVASVSNSEQTELLADRVLDSLDALGRHLSEGGSQGDA